MQAGRIARFILATVFASAVGGMAGGTLVDTADRVMALGAEFVHQLTLLAELAGGFKIEAESIVEPVRNAISSQDKLIEQPYESRWPPRPNEPIKPRGSREARPTN